MTCLDKTNYLLLRPQLCGRGRPDECVDVGVFVRNDAPSSLMAQRNHITRAASPAAAPVVSPRCDGEGSLIPLP